MKSFYGIKIQQALIWLILIGILYLLRTLFPVIFITFVLSYIGNSILKLMEKRLQYRRLNLTIVYVIFLLIIIGILGTIVPRVIGEARTMTRDYLIQQAVDAERAEIQKTSIAARNESDIVSDTAVESIVTERARRYLDSALMPFMDRSSMEALKKSALYNEILVKIDHNVELLIPVVIRSIGKFINHLFALALQFLIAFIFSYIILWDLPNLSESVKSFSTGRTAELYEVVAPGIRTFGIILGKAFEAQTVIAIVNSILTSIGFILLGLPSIALLATIVFFCSYIPVLGVILSTVPAAIVAFKTGGILYLILLVIIILIAHAVEAYILNPIIYGHHMKMHPIAVLVILMIGEHLFGVWGLLLGVPVSAFVLKYIIRGEISE